MQWVKELTQVLYTNTAITRFPMSSHISRLFSHTLTIFLSVIFPLRGYFFVTMYIEATFTYLAFVL